VAAWGTALGVGGRGVGGGCAVDEGSVASEASAFSVESFCSLLGEPESAPELIEERFGGESRTLLGARMVGSTSSLLLNE
jgi:hypothetical protein